MRTSVYRRRTTAGIFAAGALLCAAGDARANDFYLGYNTTTLQIELCDHTLSTAYAISGGAPPLGTMLTGNVVRMLTSGNDRAQVVRVPGTPTSCGPHDPILFNGFQVSLNGAAGDDILTGGLGDMVLIGDIGNDSLTLLVVAGFSDGGWGDDCLLSRVAGGGEVLLGHPGVDCLEQAPTFGSAFVFDCGDDVDDFRSAGTTVPVRCENPVGTCSCPTF